MIPEEVAGMVRVVRGQRVMLDFDLGTTKATATRPSARRARPSAATAATSAAHRWAAAFMARKTKMPWPRSSRIPCLPMPGVHQSLFAPHAAATIADCAIFTPLSAAPWLWATEMVWSFRQTLTYASPSLPEQSGSHLPPAGSPVRVHEARVQ